MLIHAGAAHGWVIAAEVAAFVVPLRFTQRYTTAVKLRAGAAMAQ